MNRIQTDFLISFRRSAERKVGCGSQPITLSVRQKSGLNSRRREWVSTQ
jgi:hypothetical protein